MSRRKKSLSKEINPTYYVFCEGQTEEEYVKMLKQHYRIPIEIKSKIEGSSISEKGVKSFLKNKQSSSKDRTFLLYDIDVKSVFDKIKAIKNTTLLVSSPCIELWFLLHFKEHNTHISTNECIKALNKSWKSYKRGTLTNQCKQDLLHNQKEAVYKAEKLSQYRNPSTTIPEFIKLLDEFKHKKRG